MGSSEHEYKVGDKTYIQTGDRQFANRSNLNNDQMNDAQLMGAQGATSRVKEGWKETDFERQRRENAFASNGADARALNRTQQLASDVRMAPNQQMDMGAADRSLGGFLSQQQQANDARGLAMNAYGQQQGLANMLAQRANGQGPSAAQAVLQQGRDQSVQNALAIANSGRGNRGLAMREAQMAGTQAMHQAANQASILRAQEQQAATGQLGQALGMMAQTGAGIRGQDMDAGNQFLAARGQDIGVAGSNLAAAIQQDQFRTNTLGQLNQQTFGYDNMSRDQRIQQQIYLDQIRAQEEAMARNYASQQQQQIGQYVGAGLAAAGTIAASAASDERVKTNITDGSKSLHRFLSEIGSHEYEYKDPGKPLRGEGRFVSPMAQELERTELGKSMVKDTPDGKVVDYGKGLGTFLAALADQHKRISKLEGDDE